MNEKEIKEAEPEKVSFVARLWTIPAYIWVFAFVPYFLKRKNKFVYFHAKQGVILFITEIIAVLISAIPVIGQIIGIILFILCAFFSIKGMIMGLRGKYWTMPWLGKYTEKV
ncbi:MAG: DUF4870 domain-containing protein [Patescibacteria group bacterium]